MTAVPRPPVRAARWSLPPTIDPDWSSNWIAALGFAALCILFSFPGRLNADSLFALIAAATPGMANNWHSATLGWFWGLLAPLFGQPLAALVMQAGLFGLFAGFLPRIGGSVQGRIALAGELLLRAVLAASMGYIGKDAVMLLTLLVAVQLLRRLPRTRLGWAGGLVLAAVSLLFLLAKAPNFLVPVVALALVLPFFGWPPRRSLAVLAATLAVGALAVPLNRIVDAQVFAARDLHPDKQLVLFDLAGISVHTGHNAFDGVPSWPTRTLSPPAACYVPYMWDSFAHWAPCGGYANAYDRLDGPLKRRWAEQVAAHPLAYLRHRLDYVRYLMESRDHATWGIAGQAINDATNPAALAEMQRGMTQLGAHQPIGLWHPTVATPLLRGLEQALFRFPKVQWFGLFACLAVLLACWIRRADGIRLGAILAAGLGTGNFAMLAVFGVANPARYLLPTVALAYVALLALLAPAARLRPAT